MLVDVYSERVMVNALNCWVFQGAYQGGHVCRSMMKHRAVLTVFLNMASMCMSCEGAACTQGLLYTQF